MKPGLVRLSCEDKDPLLAKKMLEYFADYGNQVFRRVSVGSAAEQVHSAEKHVIELRAQTDESAAQMRAFQEKYQNREYGNSGPRPSSGPWPH